MDSGGDRIARRLNPVTEARGSQLLLHSKVRLCEWHEEIRKRLPLQFLQMKVVANQQSVDSGFRCAVK